MLPFDFAQPPAFDVPLVPPADQWPLFDEVLFCTPPAESDTLLASALADMPIPPSRTSPRNKNPAHIPRPRNAFMLFRSAFSAAQKISSNVERDNRHITRIIAHCWNRLPDTDKQVWRDKAAAEKAQHAKRYPNYRFSPVGRANKPAKRKVRRNGAEDVKRCERLAELVMAGKHGKELEKAAEELDSERQSLAHPIDMFTDLEIHRTHADREPGPGNVPPFRSPLLPPAKTVSQQVPDDNFIPESPVLITTTDYVEPDTFCSLTDPSTLDSLKSLFGTPCHQYHQPSVRDVVSSPRSNHSFPHLASILRFVQKSYAELEQSAPDYSLFSWNQSDSFSYHH